MRTKKDILQQILMNSDAQISLLTSIQSELNEMLKLWERVEKQENQNK